jgi:7,8-dihydropterin-6-yl-methyl-4-(beta-D-ribofuranosyl)aminobenzene 5'-phosphate synthase
MYLTGEVPRENLFEEGDAGLFCDDEGFLPDRVPDDQSLVIGTDRGLVILLGCCHAGVVNTIEHAREKTGVERVYAVIGGAHLGYTDQDRIDQTVRALRGYRIQRICPGHCTGFAASARLFREFPGRFHPVQVGFTIEI